MDISPPIVEPAVTTSVASSISTKTIVAIAVICTIVAASIVAGALVLISGKDDDSDNTQAQITPLPSVQPTVESTKAPSIAPTSSTKNFEVEISEISLESGDFKITGEVENLADVVVAADTGSFEVIGNGYTLSVVTGYEAEIGPFDSVDSAFDGVERDYVRYNQNYYTTTFNYEPDGGCEYFGDTLPLGTPCGLSAVSIFEIRGLFYMSCEATSEANYAKCDQIVSTLEYYER